MKRWKNAGIFMITAWATQAAIIGCDQREVSHATAEKAAESGIEEKNAAQKSADKSAEMGEDDLTDQRLERAVVDRLLMEGAFPDTQVNVDVKDGVVTMEGKAFSLHEKMQAMQLVRTTKGVRSIIDEIEVPQTDIPDAEVKDRVENALFRDPATEAFEVQVSVDKGKVTLTGSVDSWAEKRLARTVAASVMGVTEVENEIEIDEPIVRPDDEIEREIERRFATSTLVDDGLVDVDVDSGVVSVSGIVGSAAERWYAVANAWVEGVSRVEHEDLEVQWWDRERFRRDASQYVKDDEKLVEAVGDALRVDPRVTAQNIEVHAERGEITLSGEVPSLRAKLAAEETARNTIGVFRVRNHLEVDLEKPVKDEELKERVERAFDTSPYVNDFKGTVRVNDGYVTLVGTVGSQREKQQAELVAQRVQGVRYVENDLDLYWRKLADLDLKSDVENELFWNVFVDSKDIDIAVEKGAVTLTGEVDDFQTYREASEAVLDAGALHVINQLDIVEGRS